MEETVNSIVNFGIGTVKTLDEQAQDILSQAEAKINEYIAAGEGATDENSAKVKDFVADALKGYKELEEQVVTFTEDVTAQFKSLTASETVEAPKAETEKATAA